MKTITRATVFIAILLLMQCAIPSFIYKVKAEQTDLLYPGNNCLNFTVANQRVDCGQHSIYEAEKPTIEAWVKPKFRIQSGSDATYGTTWGTIVCLRQPGNVGGGWYFGFYYPTGKLHFIIDAGVDVYSDKQNWYNDSWYYLAVTYDPTLPENNLVFYVNGTVDSYHNATTALAYSSPALQIGSQSGWNYLYYLGLLDEVRVWNVSRTKTEIQNTWNKTLNNPNETATAYLNLVGYWHFDNLIEGNYLDHSIYNNDAVPTVAPELGTPGAPIIAVPEFSSSTVMVVVMAAGTLGALLLRRRPRKSHPESCRERKLV